MKFRVWDSFNGEYTYSHEFQAKGPIKNSYSALSRFFLYVSEIEHAGNNPIMERGIDSQDIDGNEIYEGHIVKDSDDAQVCPHLCDFHHPTYSVKWDTNIGRYGFFYKGMCCDLIAECDDLSEHKIIGNIHENPELLEEKK